MKTIEERAKQWATNYPKTPDATYANNDIEAIAENSFIQGATEQKAIDDAERDTAVCKFVRSIPEKQKKKIENDSTDYINRVYKAKGK